MGAVFADLYFLYASVIHARIYSVGKRCQAVSEMYIFNSYPLV